MEEHKFGYNDIENMLPWERDVYVALLVGYMKEKEKELESQRRKHMVG